MGDALVGEEEAADLQSYHFAKTDNFRENSKRAKEVKDLTQRSLFNSDLQALGILSLFFKSHGTTANFARENFLVRKAQFESHRVTKVGDAAMHQLEGGTGSSDPSLAQGYVRIGNGPLLALDAL